MCVGQRLIFRRSVRSNVRGKKRIREVLQKKINRYSNGDFREFTIRRFPVDAIFGNRHLATLVAHQLDAKDLWDIGEI